MHPTPPSIKVLGVLARFRTTPPLPQYNPRLRLLSTMATSKRMVIPTSNTGLLKFDQTDEAAKKTAWLLQKDLEVDI